MKSLAPYFVTITAISSLIATESMMNVMSMQ